MDCEATRCERAKAIFSKAEDLSDAAERVAYLDVTCAGDIELRDEVERLLAAAEEAGDFMATPAVGLFSATQRERTLDESPGTVIGPYKLMEQIGEGGFGLVFVAEQLHPVRRQVGLKIIKPGMDTRQVIARFEAERQALALMDHPNIAKVFDAGTTASGRPYFVMELVRGVPITQYCDEHNLTVHERLELFTALCHAIQHAHQKGIIHRDVKPSNVLVTLHDGKPVPKVIDFGVAKALSQRLTERTVYTQFAQMIGTPLYMSPEQAELNGLDIDTRSDIYSLGVVLYELLTGTTPFEQERLTQAALDEIRRIVREEDPPTPSARLGHSGERLVTTAAQRRVEPAQLTKQVHGELDWIVMKCLEKDRNRRYETATALARDVERYLTDEPVQAYPPSALYRFGKLARRNKVALFTALLVFASLLIGSAVATWQAIRATRAEQIAIAKSEQAASEAAKATAISNLLLEMLDSANPDAARGADYTVRQMLDQFADGLGEQLRDQPEAEATIRLTIGNAYRRLGLLDQAEAQIEAALAQRQLLFGQGHVLVADALIKKAWLLEERQDYLGSQAVASEALAVCRKVGGTPKETLAALDVLFLSTWKEDETDEDRLAPIAQEILEIAEQKPDGYPQVADLLHRLAGTARYLGDYAKAERLGRESVALHSKLQGDHHPETAWGLLELGRALYAQDKLGEANQCYNEGLTIFRRCYGDSHKFVVQAYGGLADVLGAQGDEKGLDELRAKAIEIDTVDDPDWECWQDRAHLHNKLGQWNEEVACFRKAIELAAPRQAASLYLELGQALSNLGKLDEAKTCFNDALAIFRKNYRDSETPILTTFWNLGRTAWCQGDEEGYPALTAKIKELANADEPDCESWALRGTMLFLMGHCELAETCLRNAIELAPPRRAAELHLDLAVTLIAQGNQEEAAAEIHKMIAAQPDKEAVSLNYMALRLILTGETSGPGVTRAVELAERAVQLAPGEHDYWTALGIAHYRAHEWQTAIDALTKAVDMGDGGNAVDRLFLAMAHWQNGDQDEARTWYDRAADWLDKEGSYRPELRRYRRDAAEMMGIAAPQSSAEQPIGEKDNSTLP